MATDDAGKGCADELITIDLSDNYSDTDSASVGITMLGGLNIADGQTISLSGTDSNGNAYAGLDVTRNGDEFIFNGESAFADYDIGEEATATIEFKVEDSDGGSAAASVAVTFCGDANSAQSLSASLPDTVTYQVIDGTLTQPFPPEAFDVKILTADGDTRLENVTFTQAYCLDSGETVAASTDFATAPINTGALLLATDANAGDVFSATQIGVNGQTAAQNLSAINWIINQCFEEDGTGAIDGTFSAWEVQFAIWELTNSFDSDGPIGAAPEFGQIEDVDFIVQEALANGGAFTPGVGDKIGLIIDPGEGDPNNGQPFILAIDWEDVDCLCIDNGDTIIG